MNHGFGNGMRDQWALQALVEAAGELDWRRVRGVLGEDLTGAMGSESARLPASLVDMVTADGDIALLTKIAANRNLTPSQCDTVLTAGLAHLDDRALCEALVTGPALRHDAAARSRLAATGHPTLVDLMSRTGWFTSPQRRTLLAATTDQAALRVLLSSGWDGALRAAVVSPVPEVVWHVLRKLGNKLSAAEQLLAVRSLLAAGVAPAEVITAAALRFEVGAVLADLADGAGSACLETALAVAEGTEGLIAELYDRDVSDVDDHIEARTPIDWDALTTAARKRPFTKDATTALVARKDCPDALRDVLFTRHPAMVVQRAHRLGPTLLSAECPPRNRAKATREVIAKALGGTVSGAEVLQYGRPARAVLESLRSNGSSGSDREAAVGEFRAALVELLAEWPGADVGAWRRVRQLVPEFTGTVAQLLDAARQSSDPAAPIPGPARELDSAHEAFMTLLDAAPVTAHAALLPVLPSSVQYDLIKYTTWRPEWVDMAIAADGPQLREWVAAVGELGAEEIDRLALAATDEMIILLMRQTATTKRQRATWLRDPSPQLLERLRNVRAKEYWRLSDLLVCADPAIHEAIGEYCQYLPNAKGTVAQLRLAGRIWQEDGPELLRRLLPEQPFNRDPHAAATAVITELIARPDADAALAELLERVCHGESAAGQIEAWRTRADLAALAEEDHQWHWAALAAEHAKRPFNPTVVYRMASLDGCPASLREQAKTVLPPRSHRAYTALMAGKDPAKVLRANPADGTDRSLDSWIPVAMSSGRLAWDDVLRHAHPAAVVLEHLVDRLDRARWETGGSEALRKLVADRVGDDTEAWLLAVQMAPDFPGSVDELLTTSAEAVRQPPASHHL